MALLRLLAINPITKWFQWLIMQYRLKSKYNSISVGYMSEIINSSFSQENHIFPFARIVNTQLGNFSYVGGSTYIFNASIGHFCSIASDCRIGLGIHPTDFISTHPCFYASKGSWSIRPNQNVDFLEYKNITIGHDVWIGTRAIIVDGVKIANGAIIAAGALVTKDVPAYSIVGGVPAKVIKYRFSKEIIKELEKSKWWEWKLEAINKHKNEFINVDLFISNLATQK